jgi:hypothetical protein
MEATVEQPGDGRVIELGENLTFATEAHRVFVAVEPAPYELERDELNELAISALGPIHDAHASTPELVEHAIWTYTSTSVERTLLRAVSRRHRPAEQPCLGAIIQEVACSGVSREQLLDSLTEGGVVAADAFEQRASSVAGEIQCLIKQRFEPRPARFRRWGVHPWPARAL